MSSVMRRPPQTVTNRSPGWGIRLDWNHDTSNTVFTIQTPQLSIENLRGSVWVLRKREPGIPLLLEMRLTVAHQNGWLFRCIVPQHLPR